MKTHLLIAAFLLLSSCSQPLEPTPRKNTDTLIASQDSMGAHGNYSTVQLLSSKVKKDTLINGTGLVVIKPGRKIQRNECLEFLIFVNEDNKNNKTLWVSSDIHWLDSSGNLKILIPLNFAPHGVRKTSEFHTFLVN